MASSIFVGFLGGIPWSTSGTTVTFTGTVSASVGFLAGDGTAAAPSYSFASDDNTGLYLTGSSIGFSDEGSVQMVVGGNVIDIGPRALAMGATHGSVDVSLSRLTAGSWASTGPNGSATNVRKAMVSQSTTGGLGTVTATNLIPAGSLVIGVDARVTTVIVGAGMTSFSIGDGSDADRWGTGILLAAGTTVTLANATINAAPIYAAATSVVLTANAGQFDSGVIRLTVHYLSLTAATS